MFRARCYLASPITSDPKKWVRKACEVTRQLLEAGIAVYTPQLSVLMEYMLGKELPWETWLEQDKRWVLVSDFVLRLPGDSPGADLEVAWAEAAGIPVVTSVGAAIDTYGER